MKLLKTLDQRYWTTSTNKSTSATFGLFECKYCHKNIELPLSKGIKQKSCGSKECSIQSHRDGYNHKLSANNCGNTKDNRTKDPYYSTLKESYRLYMNKLSKININNFETFYDIVNLDYTELRKKYNKIKINIINENITLKPTITTEEQKLQKVYSNKLEENNINIIQIQKEIDVLISTMHISKKKMIETKMKNTLDMINEHEYTTYSLSNEINQSNVNIVKRIDGYRRKKNNPFYENKINILGQNIGKKIYILSKEQYNFIKDAFKIVNMSKSTIVYIIKSSFNEYKIGITTDIKSKLGIMHSQSSPSVSYEAIYYNEIGYDAHTVEQAIHKKLKILEKHIQYEWFNLDNTTINKIKLSIKNHKEFIDKFETEEYQKQLELKEQKKLNLLQNKIIKAKEDRTIFLEKQEKLAQRINEKISEKEISLKMKLNIKKEKEQIRQENKEIKSKKDNKNQKRTTYVTHTKHDMSGTKIYHVWQQMKSQAKEVPFEPAWDDFSAWYEDFGKHKPDDNHQMMRKVGSKGFVKDNVVWVTIAEARKMQVARPVIRVSNTSSEYLYPSAIEAAHSTAKATPGHITACCRGKRKSHAGYGWKYDTIVA